MPTHGERRLPAVVRDTRTFDLPAVVRVTRTFDLSAVVRDTRTFDLPAMVRDTRTFDLSAVVRDTRTLGAPCGHACLAAPSCAPAPCVGCACRAPLPTP